jgi:tetratricopeptide (TPR) repeat protein
VHADDETTFMSDYKTIAKKLNISTELDDDELLEAVRDAIETLGPYVLVLDNADNLTVFGVGREGATGGENTAGKMARNLFAFVPRHSGTVLWTSRDKRISGSLVGANRAINVARMMDSEAMALLETVGNMKIAEGALDDAAQLLAQLDWLPLAVSQAAAYIRRMSITLEEYLSMLARHRKRWKVLQESDFDRHRRPGLSNSILETWDISMEQIRQENKLAYDILHVLAFLDNQNIPLEIMIKVATLRSGELTDERQSDECTESVISGSDSEDDDDEVLHAATRLQEFSFLHLRATECTSRAYEMHKLVQEATQYALRRRHRREDEVHFSNLALRVVTSLFPQHRWKLWGECEKYVLHAQRAAEWAELCEGEIEACALLNLVSNYMYDRGRWREKEPVDKRGYDLLRRRLGERHPDTMWYMAALGSSYHAQGRYKEGEKMSVEVLALQRDVLGEKHPDTIKSMANLAVANHTLGRYEEAEKMLVEVLALQRNVLGEKHPETIRSIWHRSMLYYNQGRYEEAEKMSVEGLALRREVLGEKHPNTIQSIVDLATIYLIQGRLEKAEKMLVEVLPLQRNVLGEKHPDMIRSMTALAATYRTQGRYEEAEKISVEGLALRRDVLGEKHPNTIHSIVDLAMIHLVQGRLEKAEKMLVEVLPLQRNVLGEKHPDMIRSMAVLAETYCTQGRYEEAENMSVQVLALRRDILGEKHPDTAVAMQNLAITLDRRQRRSEALVMMHECFQLQCKVLGQTHPSTQISLQWLDSWGTEKGKRERAVVNMDRILGHIAHRIRARISK